MVTNYTYLNCNYFGNAIHKVILMPNVFSPQGWFCTWAAPKIWVGQLSEKCMRQVSKSLKKALKTRFLSKFCRGT